MNQKILTPRFITLTTIIIAGAFMRLIPHWPNFTPIAAMALFGGAYYGRKYLAFVIPMAAMFLSDMILGFHMDMMAVYLAFAFTVLIGWSIRNNISFGSVLTRSLLASVVFFLLTNFSSWLTMGLYPKNFTGLMEAYIAGLAFFNNGSYGVSFFLNEVFGSLFYNLAFFGAFYLAQIRFPALARTN